VREYYGGIEEGGFAGQIGRKSLCEESIYNRILELVCVGHRIPLIKADDLSSLVQNTVNKLLAAIV